MQSLARGLGSEDPNHWLPSGLYPPHQVPQVHCDDLNGPFTVEEIDISLQALANGKSPGRNGFPAELFRHAQPPVPPGDPYSPNILSPLIADIFTLALRKHTIPVETNVCLVTPVYKQGDAYDTEIYRPIAVGDSLMRLYANALKSRLVSYLENNR